MRSPDHLPLLFRLAQLSLVDGGRQAPCVRQATERDHAARVNLCQVRPYDPPTADSADMRSGKGDVMDFHAANIVVFHHSHTIPPFC